MNCIRIFYWHLSPFKDLKYKHNEVFEYTSSRRNKIVDDILSKGYSVMLRPLSDGELMIAIDNGRFGQR